MLCNWEGNHSNLALAMHYRLSSILSYWLIGLLADISMLPTLSIEYMMNYQTFTVSSK